MKDPPIWDAVWDRVKLSLEEMAGAVKEVLPVVGCRISRTRSDTFPFDAAASFSRTGASDVEDAVVTVSGKAQGEQLHMSADVARGDGIILVDGPIVDVTAHAKADLGRDLESWLIDIRIFLLQEAVQCLVCELR